MARATVHLHSWTHEVVKSETGRKRVEAAHATARDWSHLAAFEWLHLMGLSSGELLAVAGVLTMAVIHLGEAHTS